MRTRAGFLLAGLILLFSPHALGFEAQLYYASDIAVLTTLCFPQGIKLESKPIEGIVWPEAEGSSLYGVLHLGASSYPLWIDHVKEEVRLSVDVDQSGELEAIAWERMLSDGSLLASAPLQIAYGNEQTASYRVFLGWSPFTPAVVTYCRRSYQAGDIELGDKRYRLAIVDEDTDGRYDDLENGTLLLDVDGDGEFLLMTDSHEIFSLAEPFNLDGVVYQVAAVSPDGSWMQVLPSEVDVAPRLPLLPGFSAPSFEAVDANGKAFSLDAQRGRVVVLDFWASWCAPCIAELPTFEQITREFSMKDVVVVGVNRDRSESAFRAAIEDYGIDTLQIYDSDVGPVGDIYRIAGIPMTYIIDRAGMIVARGLRGEALVAAIRDVIESED